ncbi:hypothetical protein N431DRAFT_467860 [Stipitochalara longipes BDJ]|nr:hypothetical protein N431DRAFT_467860 [Stipitochalara longipes BDJ]
MYNNTYTYKSGKYSSKLGIHSKTDFSNHEVQTAIRSLPWKSRLAYVKTVEASPGSTPEIGHELEKVLHEPPVAPEGLLELVASSQPHKRFQEPTGQPNTYKPNEQQQTSGHEQNADSSRLKASLKTPTGEYNEVLAISQGLVNSSFRFLYALRPEMHTINISNRYGSLVSNLLPPQISLNFGDGARPYYYMNFGTGGVLTVYDDDDVEHKISTSGWVFVFEVGFSQVALENNTPEREKIEEMLDHPGLYSISLARITDPVIKLCDFKGYVFTEDIKITFQYCVSRHISEMLKDRTSQTIGYTWTTQNPEGAYVKAPSFPPTAMILQSYPYYEDGQIEPVVGLGKGDNNMLLYSEMTNKRPIPKEQKIIWKGNFISPSPTPPKTAALATMTIGTQVFWNEFLLGNSLGPLLTRMNEATWLEAKVCRAEYGAIENDFEYDVGPVDTRPPSFYDWVPKDDGTGWKWEKTTGLVDEDTPTDGFSAEAGLWTGSSNDITIIPGSNRITVSGRSYVNLFSKSVRFGIEANGSAEVWNTWSFTIDAVSILEGGLEFDVNIPANNSDLFYIKTRVDNSFFKNEDFMKEMADDVRGWIGLIDIRHAATELKTLLTGTAKFFLPGAGDFFYKNPIFTNEKDLTVDATYNGVSDWLGRQPQAIQTVPVQE